MKKLFIGAFLLAGVMSAKAQINDQFTQANKVKFETSDPNTQVGPGMWFNGSLFKMTVAPTYGKTMFLESTYTSGNAGPKNSLKIGYSDNFLELREKVGAGSFNLDPHLYAPKLYADILASPIIYAENNMVVGENKVNVHPLLFSSNPNYSLFVYGGIMTEEVNVKLSLTWADYVFAPDYKLLSLSETEQYIAKNKHLPNIPSADEVADQGVSLGEMSVLQMEKIEELTLHLIQVNKEKDALEKRMEVLEALILKE